MLNACPFCGCAAMLRTFVHLLALCRQRRVKACFPASNCASASCHICLPLYRRAGFTTGTGDGLWVVNRYVQAKPVNNTLAPYVPALARILAERTGNASALSEVSWGWQEQLARGAAVGTLGCACFDTRWGTVLPTQTRPFCPFRVPQQALLELAANVTAHEITGTVDWGVSKLLHWVCRWPVQRKHVQRGAWREAHTGLALLMTPVDDPIKSSSGVLADIKEFPLLYCAG